MIQYIENNQGGSIIYQEDGIHQSPLSSLSYIKKRCIQSFFTYEGYLKAVQKIYGKAYKIPVYLDFSLMMIPTKRVRDYDNIWINYAAIDEIIERNEGLEIHFFGERQIHIKYSLNTFKNQIEVLSFIRSNKVKHFHS